MRETAAELTALQALIDRSHKRIGKHMGAITHPKKYALTATQVVKLVEGMKTVAVAAPAPNGDPLVAPMDGWFLHGKWFFSTGGESGERFLINAHGSVVLMFRGHPDVGEVDAVFKDHYGGSAFDWSDGGAYVRLDADRFFTYSRTPKKFPS